MTHSFLTLFCIQEQEVNISQSEPSSNVQIEAGIEAEKLESFDELIQENEEETSIQTGKKVIVPTMEILDQETLDKEIQDDSREAELLIQLKHLNARVEAQDTLLAELKEENTVLKIQNQNLLESLNRITSKPSLFRKSSKEFQSLEYQVIIFLSLHLKIDFYLSAGFG